MKPTKEEFKKTLRQLTGLVRKEDRFCSCLEDISVDSGIVSAFIFSEPTQIILDLLRKAFDDEGDDIGHFLYDMNAIENPDLDMPLDHCPTDENGDILYHDADSLYDYLTRDDG